MQGQNPCQSPEAAPPVGNQGAEPLGMVYHSKVERNENHGDSENCETGR